MTKKTAIVINSKYFINNYLSNSFDIYLLKLNVKQKKYAIKNTITNVIGACYNIIVKSHLPNNFSYNIYNNQNQLFDDIIEKKYKYVFLLNVGVIIRKRNIDLLDGKLFNIHPSFLPFFSGRHSITRSIFQTRTIGITLHQVTKNIDKGKIIYQNYKKPIHFYDIKKIRNFYEKEINFIITNIYDVINRRLKKMPKRLIEFDSKYLDYSVDQPNFLKYTERLVIIIVFIITLKIIQ